MSEVFISYSRKDKEIIGPIVNLIRAMKDDLVFQDFQNIKPGKKWKPQILEAISKAKIIVVFWCEHSFKSRSVKEEYNIAIKKNKDVLPLLLDETELVEALNEYQWIDLKNFHVHKPKPDIGKVDKVYGLHPNRMGGSGGYRKAEYELDKKLKREIKEFQKNQKKIAQLISDGINKKIT